LAKNILTSPQIKALDFMFSTYSEDAWDNLMCVKAFYDAETVIWEPFEDYPEETIAILILQLMIMFERTERDARNKVIRDLCKFVNVSESELKKIKEYRIFHD